MAEAKAGVLARFRGALTGSQGRAAVLFPDITNEVIAGRYTSGGSIPTVDESKTRVAVGSAIRLLQGAVRIMPMAVFRGSDADTQVVTTPPVLRDPEGLGYGLGDFLVQVMEQMAARGNAFVEITVRDSRALPAAVAVRSAVTVYPLPDGKTWRVGQNLVQRDQLIHFRPFPVAGYMLGDSPIGAHARTIGTSISAERFGKDFFDAGGHPTTTLSSDMPMTEEQGRKVKDSYLASTRNREPVMLPGGIQAKAVQVAPEESQFLETQKYTEAECARIFGPGVAEILGYATNSSMTYANVSDRNMQLLIYALNPYLNLIEDMMSRLFVPNPQYVKFNRNALLEMNAKDRFALYATAIQNGIMTPNEARGKENLAPVAWGDQPYVAAKAAGPSGGDAGSEPATDTNAPKGITA